MISGTSDNEAEQHVASDDLENRYIATLERAHALYEAGDVDGAQDLWAASEDLAVIVNGQLTVDDTAEHSDTRAELLARSALIVAGLIHVGHDGLMLAHALHRAVNGWPVFPLRGKTPAIGKAAGGNGVLDATLDLATIASWWGGKYRGANIGGRVPAGLFVLDGDPRKPGHLEAAQALVADHGPLTPTLMTVSGRLDGGSHRFYRHPGGTLSTHRLGPGFDIKTSSGYVVLPPSIHPDSSRPYIEVDLPIAEPDQWLVELLRPEPKPLQPNRLRPPLRNLISSSGTFWNDSIADQYSENTTWNEILEPHGWRHIAGTGDDDGSIWLHPTHTSSCSASIRWGQLFVYSTSTVFEVTEGGDCHGYTRFRAYAALNHGGDLSAAARELRTQKKAS